VAYKIISRKGAKQTTAQWIGKFGAAKAHADDLVKSGVADRVDIRDDQERLRYHCPRMMRRA